jgi:hypothetical protein
MAAAPSSRDDLRAKLLGTTHKRLRTKITLFGVEVELLQPTVGEIQDSVDTDWQTDVTTGKRTLREGARKYMMINQIILCAVVPGTDVRIFDFHDRDSMIAWPNSADLMAANKAINEMTDINILTEKAVKK